MRLAIDASNIRFGGGVTHLVELLRAAEPSRHGFRDLVVWSGRHTLDAIEPRPWIRKAHEPALDDGLSGRILWQHRRLANLVRRAGCDLLFVPGGTYLGGFRPMVTMSQNLLPFEWGEVKRYGISGRSLKSAALRVTQAATFRRAEGVIFLTAYARRAVLQVTGELPCPTAIVPHGLRDLFVCEPRPQEALSRFSPDRPFRLLYVSTIEMYKHQWHVADAVARLYRSGIPIVLDLVGPAYPPALVRLRRALAEHDPDGRCVKYWGAVPRERIHEWYRQADMAVLASTCETFGQILTEAMCAGLPVACADRSALPELLGDAGVYFDPERPEDIARALRWLLEHPEARARNARAGFARVGQYSWERCADETFGFLRLAMDQARGVTPAHPGRA